MKAKDYYPTYIPRKWIHFAEHGRKYRIRKKYRNRILQTVSSHPSDFETVLFNVMQHTSRSGITTAEFCRGLTAPPLPDYFRDCSPDDGIQIPDDIRQLSEKLEELKEIIERTLSPVFDRIKELAGKIVKIVRDAVDRIWCNDRHWWYMAEHHKKRRIRKKYRTKIKRMARDRARKLLHSLGCDTPRGAGRHRGRRRRGGPLMARKNSQARQAACRICGKDWQISALAVIPPSGYVCPVCETKQRKERLYGNETTQKRGIQNPAKYQHRTRYTPGK